MIKVKWIAIRIFQITLPLLHFLLHFLLQFLQLLQLYQMLFVGNCKYLCTKIKKWFKFNIIFHYYLKLKISMVQTTPFFNLSISCFSILVSNLAAMRAFSSLLLSRLSIFLCKGTIFFCLLNWSFLIRMRYCVIFTNLCLHFALINPGQYNKFSFIWCIAFSKFLDNFTFSKEFLGKWILKNKYI